LVKCYPSDCFGTRSTLENQDIMDALKRADRQDKERKAIPLERALDGLEELENEKRVRDQSLLKALIS